MYLKRLDLQGFKSFHAHTQFEFGPGMTAVVGPNGSGKSNVAESIRWVLGEQTARSIRTRRLEDVIFSGSSQRAAVGMAEVSMTFDNSDGWLPLDFSEVVVSRRAYRSGDSEYLINKSKVRLRDVLDLFLRAQVGQNSYAFMGQGLVEEVLVMRPEERRRLLEEAADVRLLRTRLDEARDRLSATRENLERVQLLLDEIGPRLAQLERQASRAAEHGRLARELADSLRELYSRLWEDANAALASARAAFDQRQQELTVSREQAKSFEDGMAALTGAVEERQKDIGNRRTQQRELSDRVHSLQRSVSFDSERLEAQSRRRVEVEQELQSLRDQRIDIQAALATAQERARSIAPEAEGARDLIATRRQEMNALEQEQGALRRRIGEAEERVERLQRGVREAEAGLSRLADEESSAQGETLRHASRRKELLERLTEVGAAFKGHRDRLRALESEIAEGEHERVGLAGMVESGRSVLHALETEAMQLEGLLGQLGGRQTLLHRLQAAQEGVDDGARFLMGEQNDSTSTARGTVDGLVGLVRDIVRVPPGLERAVEAALAENVQALVFENSALALAAIEELEAHEAGRALIYPLDMIRTAPPLNLMRERGIIGVAARLVRCDNHFRPLVDVLLGRVIVVETVELAREVLKRGLGSIVTMDGALLRANGAISGGISKAATESFTRQRELDELPGQIAAAEADRREVNIELQRERDALTGASAALAQIEPSLHALREERARRQNQLLENRGHLILLRSEARSLWADLHRGDDTTDWRGRRARLTRERTALETEAKGLTETVSQDRVALSALAGRRNAAIDAVSEATAAQADLEGESRSLARQVELQQAELRRSEDRLRSREESLRAIDAELKTLRERGDGGSTELAAVQVQLTSLNAELEPSEGELAHLVSRERSMREEMSTARNRLMAAERSHLEAESALKLRSDEIDSLRETMLAEGYQPQGRGVAPINGEPEASPEQGGRVPPVRGGAEVTVETLRTRIGQIRSNIRGLGPVNEQAQADYGESKERIDFLKGQVDDLEGSQTTLQSGIEELESNIRERLKATFAVVDAQFQRYFESFFNGGSAHLSLTQPEDFANTGIDIVAQPPGKRVHSLAMLSGGERTLTALALLLSLLETHPSPICVLDEVDAALDEGNVGRFVEALKELETKTQFIVITHNPRTVEAASSIYGISMGADNTSRVLSLRLDDVKKS